MLRLLCFEAVMVGALAFAWMGTAGAQAAERPERGKGKIPVIFDTDIGSDIDDTWALGMLLSRPEFDVKLVVGDYGLSDYRARLLAKFLETVGRTDVPVGVGITVERARGTNQAEWVEGYKLDSYPGKVYRDGVQAMIDTIMQSPEPVTLIATGPLPNVAEALKREPRIAQRARFVGMHGSVRRGYGGSSEPSAEWNVRADPQACAKVLSAPWDATITPLDTCGIVHLTGEKYQKVLKSDNPVAKAIIENYRIWAKHDAKAEKASSTLFDTVAVYLAFSTDLAKMEKLPIRVTDDGHTVIDKEAKTMNVATEWKDLGGFEDLLAATVTGQAGSGKSDR